MAEESVKKGAPKWVKVLSIVLASILFVIIVLIGTAAIVWRNEISTVANFKKVAARNDAHEDGSVYRMDVSGDFYFDDFLAQGGASSDGELINFITNSITRGLIKMDIKQSEIACSAFTAKTPSGDRLFARNYDFSKTNTALVFTNPGNGRYASFSTVDLQFLGMDGEKDVEGLMNKITCLAAPYAPLDGINEKGLSCGIFMSYQGGELDENGDEITVATDQQTDKPDITSTTMMRAMLDYCATVEEAVAFVQQYDMHDSANTSYHYMVADASGKSAILEWTCGTDKTDNDGSARTLNVIYNDDDERIGEREGASDFQWITNFVLQPGYYGEDDEKAGLDRYDRIYEELAATDGVLPDVNAAMDILKIVGRRDWNNDDGNGCTVHSVVYNLTDKTALWVTNENFDDPTAVFTIDLSKGTITN